jgi:hypothetical protein
MRSVNEIGQKSRAFGCVERHKDDDAGRVYRGHVCDVFFLIFVLVNQNVQNSEFDFVWLRAGFLNQRVTRILGRNEAVTYYRFVYLVRLPDNISVRAFWTWNSGLWRLPLPAPLVSHLQSGVAL